MTILVESVRKVVVFSYSDDVAGSHVNIEARNPAKDNELVWKKEEVNHAHPGHRGTANVSFGADYHGACELRVVGTKPGSPSDSGTITV